ncbi:MAG: hypothetical protein HFF19_03515 [Oscillospiraceae bacterium]|jgi:hypothetical protein|nr:hypothetical protein [Oscillospiraceae bacterium]
MERNERFEGEYREALDCLRFSQDGKERIMKNLMERQEREPVKAKRFRPLRTALIAAALAAALLGTAGAAQFFGVQVNFQPEEPPDVPGLGKYTVTGGVAYFPADIFSQEVWELGAQENNAKSFSTWEELEQFVGRKLMDNPVLEGAPRGVTVSSDQMQGSPTNVMLDAMNSEKGLFRIMTMDNYQLDDVLLRRHAVLYTDIAQENFVDNFGEDHEPEIAWFYEQGTQLSTEEYTTANGLAVTIVREAGRFTEYTAHFSINGVRGAIMASYQGKDWQQDNSEHVLAVLKQALDGFVV